MKIEKNPQFSYKNLRLSVSLSPTTKEVGWRFFRMKLLCNQSSLALGSSTNELGKRSKSSAVKTLLQQSHLNIGQPGLFKSIENNNKVIVISNCQGVTINWFIMFLITVFCSVIIFNINIWIHYLCIKLILFFLLINLYSGVIIEEELKIVVNPLKCIDYGHI